MSEQAPSLRGSEGDAAKLVRRLGRHGVRHPVEPREGPVGEGVVGVEESRHRLVPIKQITREELGLALHGGLQVLRVVSRKRRAIRRHITEGAQIQPAVDQAVDERIGTGAGQKTARLREEHGRLQQLPGVGRTDEVGVRHGAPKKIGEPGGQRVRGKTAVRVQVLLAARVGEVEKGGRAEHGLEPVAQGLLAGAALRATTVHHSLQAIHLVRPGGTAVGAGGEGREDLPRAPWRERLFAEHIPLCGGGSRGVERSANFHLMDTDVGDLAVPLHHHPGLHDTGGLPHLRGKGRAVLAQDAVPVLPHRERAVGEDETRGESAIEPYAEGQPTGRAVGHGGLAEPRLDGLFMMQRADAGVTRHDAEAKGRLGVVAEQAGIVRIPSVFGLGEHADLVPAIRGNPFGERQQRAIGALVHLGVQSLVEAEVAEVVHAGVGVAQLGLLLDILREAPGPRGGGRRLAEGLFHHGVRRLDVLVEQMAGGLQDIAQVVHMLHHLVAREPRGGIEHQHVQPEQVADGVEVFATVEAA